MVNGEMVIIIIFAASIRISARVEEWADILEEALALFLSSVIRQIRRMHKSES